MPATCRSALPQICRALPCAPLTGTACGRALRTSLLTRRASQCILPTPGSKALASAGPLSPLRMAAYESVSETSDLVFFRPAAREDLDRITALETAGYPPDEAASRDKMEYRLTHAPDLFMVAVKASNDLIIGFICSTATAKEQLEEETMSVHEPEGTTVCIHSVCVAAEEQRKGVATRMLTAYIQWVPQSFPAATNLQLICKEAKKGLYERVGFQLVGPSTVVHGSDPWLDMKLVL